ncbi:MAG TPA: dockerin type I domain-containing protein [Saprospiraceae bacterium]|nr:dockerin type I domain-containing protein [Saprospiraceae bacterium]
MTIKNILITITLLFITFGLRSQTSLISGNIPSLFIKNAEVEIQIVNLTQPETIIVIPDTTGHYQFQLPNGNDYKITAKLVGGERYDDFLNGVTTLDLVLIQRHILGLVPLSSASKILAADVSFNGNVTATDMVLIRKLLLGINQNFGHSISWLLRPSSNVNLEFYEIIDLQSDTTGLDFETIKLGDVNGTARIN